LGFWRVIKVLSLGAGVQSTTLLLMSCKGVLPKLDAAIFADTQWETQAVYENLSWIKQEARKAGIAVHRVSVGSLREHTVSAMVRDDKEKGERYASMPLRVKNPDGSEGMIRRQCTSEYKILPIQKYIKQEILKVKPRQRLPKQPVIELWMGISWDEKQRATMSKELWATKAYPLMEDFNPPYTREMCLAWLKTQYPDKRVPRSSCIGCPYHSNEEWRELKNVPVEWKDAVMVDNKIRHTDKRRGEVFLHRECIPLEDVDLRTVEDMGQTNLWSEECSGYCGI